MQKNDLGSDSSFYVSPSQYNPLDEPSPLGLRLRKSPSLLDLIQMRLSQPNNYKHGAAQQKKEHRCSGAAASSSSDNKLKASNFPASLLKIGTWEVLLECYNYFKLEWLFNLCLCCTGLIMVQSLQYKSRYEGDLVAKCYFAKHKLVWEILDGRLKNKIEIQWSDIIGLKADYPDEQPGTLDVAVIIFLFLVFHTCTTLLLFYAFTMALFYVYTVAFSYLLCLLA